MNTENHQRKWRNFLIRKDIQLRLAVYNLLFLLFAIGVVMATALIPLYANFQNPESLWSQHFSAKFFIVIIDRLAIAFVGIFGPGVHLPNRYYPPLCGAIDKF